MVENFYLQYPGICTLFGVNLLAKSPALLKVQSVVMGNEFKIEIDSFPASCESWSDDFP